MCCWAWSMDQYKVKNPDERLDQIVNNYYGDLDQFKLVQAANPDLIDVYLSVGDVVYLPPKKISTSEDVLW